MRIGIIVIGLLAGYTVAAQDTLQLRQAIGLALENNFAIQIAEKRAQVASNNAVPGEAGMLPNVNVSADQSWSVQNFNQQFISGDEVVRSGANSNNTTALAQLDWTLFDGLRMFTTLDRLQELEAFGNLQVQAQILETVAAVHRVYFNLVQLQKQVRVYEQALALSAERVQIAEDKFNLGSGSRLELLQAQVDYNTDRNTLLTGREQLRNAQINLSNVIGFGPQQRWVARDTIAVDPSLLYTPLREQMLGENYTLLQARSQQRVAQLSVEEAKGLRYPEVGFTTNYRFNRSAAEAGFVLSSQTDGFTYGFGLTMPVFNGFQINRQIKNAQLEAEAIALEEEQLRIQLENELASIFTAYENNKELVELEAANLAVASENLDVALESYELGIISALELRDIQNNYVLAQNRLLQAQYRLKVAEIDLKALSRTLEW